MSMTENETRDLLDYTTTDAHALDKGLAIRAWHWSLSGLIAPGKRREIEVGRRVELVCRIATTRTWQLTRRPPRSSASLDGARLVADVPGVYIVRCDLGGWLRDVELVAIDNALADRIGSADGPNDRLKTLRSRLNDGRTVESIINALESTAGWGDLACPAR
jgi:hypothetical protein